jgi:hypothetical protein
MPLVLDTRKIAVDLVETSGDFKAKLLGPESGEQVQWIEFPRLQQGDWISFYRDGREYRLVGVGHGSVRFDVPLTCAVIRPGAECRAREEALCL